MQEIYGTQAAGGGNTHRPGKLRVAGYGRRRLRLSAAGRRGLISFSPNGPW
jgi:hypothetical protein